jgi:hypothetical protein
VYASAQASKAGACFWHLVTRQGAEACSWHTTRSCSKTSCVACVYPCASGGWEVRQAMSIWARRGPAVRRQSRACTGSLGELGVARFSAAEAHEPGGGASGTGASDKTEDENFLEHCGGWWFWRVWAQTAWERVLLRIRCRAGCSHVLYQDPGSSF